jgi:fumarylacetoacetate (FAA) hydrolase
MPGVFFDGRIYRLDHALEDPTGIDDGSALAPYPVGYRLADQSGLETSNLRYLSIWQSQLRLIDLAVLDDAESWDPETVYFAPPVHHCRSFRDFYAYEQHVRNIRAHRKMDMIPEWYEVPVFYFSNHNSIIGSGCDLSMPKHGEWLDFELEIAAIIARHGRDVLPEEGESLIGGYCILNDWSLRDLQKQEMKVGLGPAKGKDFATTLGPWLVTPDELEDRQSGKGYDLEMKAFINDEQVSSGNWKDIHYSFGEMIARASAGVDLVPGDVIGSGTIGTGCILELGAEKTGGWLKAGDVVTLEVEILGRMVNRIVSE